MKRWLLLAVLSCANACATQVNEPAQRDEPWGDALIETHQKADVAIDAHDMSAARAVLLAGVNIAAPLTAKQDLLQRLAWVEHVMGLHAEATAHADQALAFGELEPRSYANALVVRHMIATHAKDQARIDALIEEMLRVLSPS